MNAEQLMDRAEKDFSRVVNLIADVGVIFPGFDNVDFVNPDTVFMQTVKEVKDVRNLIGDREGRLDGTYKSCEYLAIKVTIDGIMFCFYVENYENALEDYNDANGEW